MKLRTKVLSTVLLGSIILAGCGNEDKEIEALNAQIKSLTNQNSILAQERDSMAVTEVAPTTSLQTIEGSNIKEFKTLDGALKFPIKLTLPESYDDANKSFIRVGSRFSMEPSENWMMKMNGTKFDFTHPSNIKGSVIGVKIQSPVSPDMMQPLLKAFFTGYPKTTIGYRSLYIDETLSGMIANAKIVVDKKDHYVTVGFVSRGENSLLMLFDYEDDKSGVQQELIDLLISSMSYSEIKVRID